MTDVLRNLDNWSAVLEEIEDLRSANLLDEHQHDLARILRYPYHPRLTQAVLVAALEVREASDALIADVLGILVSRNEMQAIRVRAAQALGHLIPRRVAPPGKVALDLERVIAAMMTVARAKDLPVLAEATQFALAQIGVKDLPRSHSRRIRPAKENPAKPG